MPSKVFGELEGPVIPWFHSTRLAPAPPDASIGGVGSIPIPRSGAPERSVAFSLPQRIRGIHPGGRSDPALPPAERGAPRAEHPLRGGRGLRAPGARAMGSGGGTQFSFACMGLQ